MEDGVGEEGRGRPDGISQSDTPSFQDRVEKSLNNKVHNKNAQH